METILGGVRPINGQESNSPWEVATKSASSVVARSEITIAECAAPSRLAPHAFAMTADISTLVRDEVDGDYDDEVATGKCIVLHDPSQPEAWQGEFRVVTYIRARIESELATDVLLDEVIWSWLEEALSEHDAKLTNLSGTVTRTLSKSFGALAGREDENDVEVRASWTPSHADMTNHIQAWLEALARCAGLDPLPHGVSSLPRR